MPSPYVPIPSGVLVVDMGESVTKAGFAGLAPSVSIPTSYQAVGAGSPVFPIRRGEILDWNALEGVWQTLFDVLETDSKQNKIFVVVPSVQQAEYLKQLSHLLFDVFSVPALCFGDSCVLCACAAELQTGVILDLGSGSSTAAAIINGRTLDTCVMSTAVGGRDVTEYLRHLLLRDAFSSSPAVLASTGHDTLFEEMKEALCFCDTKPGGLAASSPERAVIASYAGVPLEHGEPWRSVELLFHPRQLVLDEVSEARDRSTGPRLLNGLHELVSHVAKKAAQIVGCPESAFCSNILLAGGTSRFRGLIDRLSMELTAALDTGTVIDVRHCIPEPHLAPWKGGAKLALSSSLPWRSRIEYLKMRREDDEQEVDTRRHVEVAAKVTGELKSLEANIVQQNLERERAMRWELEARLYETQNRANELELRERVSTVHQRATVFLQRHDPSQIPSVMDLLNHPKYLAHPEQLLVDLDDLYMVNPDAFKHTSAGIDMRIFDGRAPGLSASSTLDFLRRRMPRKHVVRQVVLCARSQGTGMFMREFAPIDAGAGPCCDSVVVSYVEKGSPAEEAGIVAGDVVVNVNGVEVINLEDALKVCRGFYKDYNRHVVETAKVVQGLARIGPKDNLAALKFIISTHDEIATLHKAEFRNHLGAAHAGHIMASLRNDIVPNRADLYSMALRGSGPLVLPHTLGEGGGGGGGGASPKDGDKKEKKKKKKDDKKGDDGGEASPKKKKKKDGEKSPKKEKKEKKKKGDDE